MEQPGIAVSLIALNNSRLTTSARQRDHVTNEYVTSTCDKNHTTTIVIRTTDSCGVMQLNTVHCLTSLTRGTAPRPQL